MDLNEMPVIERRRMEALVLGHVIRAVQEEFGEEQTNELVRKVMVGIATEQGRELAERVKGENLQEFADGKGAWRKNGALETNEIEKNPDRYEFDVTRCRYAEMYHEIGYGDLGGGVFLMEFFGKFCRLFRGRFCHRTGIKDVQVSRGLGVHLGISSFLQVFSESLSFVLIHFAAKGDKSKIWHGVAL